MTMFGNSLYHDLLMTTYHIIEVRYNVRQSTPTHPKHGNAFPNYSTVY
jgi:hypothetical protein